MKKILVIGAAQSCLGIIQTIKRLGYKSVVIGNAEDSPAKEFADHYLISKDDDTEYVTAFCKDIGVDAIVPTPVDRTLQWQAEVADRLGLIFMSPNTAENFRNKFKMKNRLQDAGIKCARGILVKDELVGTDALQSFHFPLIVKPVDAYASRGVVKVESYDEMQHYIAEATSFSSNGQTIIEEFIDGREFNAEGVCFNGSVEIYAIVEKVRDPFPRTIEMGHIIPPAITSNEENIIVETVTGAVHALSMENGAFNAEIKLCHGQGYIIEVNGRLAGDFIISHLVRPTTGQDMEEAVVRISLGLPPERARREYLKYGMISFFNLPAKKRIKSIIDFNDLHDNPHLIWAYLFFKAGDIIPEVIHMGHRSGFVIVTASDRNELFQLVEYFKNCIIQNIKYYS